jgi:hypothetical protein
MKNFKIGDKVHTNILDITYDCLNDLDGVVIEVGPPAFLPCSASIYVDKRVESYLVDLGDEYGRNYFNNKELSLVKE